MDIAGSTGYYWKDYTQLANEGISFDGLLGEHDGILLVEDEKTIPSIVVDQKVIEITVVN